MAKKMVRGEIRTKDTETGEIIITPPVYAEVEEAALPNFKPFFKTNYNHDTLLEAELSATRDFEQTLTQQHPKDETDINCILAKFGVQACAQIPHHGLVEVDTDMDLMKAIDQVRKGHDAWRTLPANVQQHFETMENYLDFVDQAVARNDRASLEQLGLVDALPPQQKAPGPQTAPEGGTPAPLAPTAAEQPPKTDPKVSVSTLTNK